jgi:hypothetical protein
LRLSSANEKRVLVGSCFWQTDELEFYRLTKAKVVSLDP